MVAAVLWVAVVMAALEQPGRAMPVVVENKEAQETVVVVVVVLPPSVPARAVTLPIGLVGQVELGLRRQLQVRVFIAPVAVVATVETTLGPVV